MRNLKEYPITREEAKRMLQATLEDIRNQELIGDIRPSILSHLLDNFDKVWDTVYKDHCYFEGFKWG